MCEVVAPSRNEGSGYHPRKILCAKWDIFGKIALRFDYKQNLFDPNFCFSEVA